MMSCDVLCTHEDTLCSHDLMLHSQIQLELRMVQVNSDLWEVGIQVRAVWRYFIMVYGAQFVMTTGT